MKGSCSSVLSISVGGLPSFALCNAAAHSLSSARVAKHAVACKQEFCFSSGLPIQDKCT